MGKLELADQTVLNILELSTIVWSEAPEGSPTACERCDVANVYSVQ